MLRNHGCDMLSEAFIHPAGPKQLTSLNLYRKWRLAPVVRVSLSWADNYIGDPGARALAKALRDPNALNELRMLSMMGLSAIVRAASSIAHNTT